MGGPRLGLSHSKNYWPAKEGQVCKEDWRIAIKVKTKKKKKRKERERMWYHGRKERISKRKLDLDSLGMFYSVLSKFLSSSVSLILLSSDFPVDSWVISLSSLSCINIMVLYLIHIFPYCRFHLSHCLRHARDFLGLQKGTQATTGLALISPSLTIGNL